MLKKPGLFLLVLAQLWEPVLRRGRRVNTRLKGPGWGGRPEGSDKDVNKQTGTGRQGRLAQLAAASGKRSSSSVMANMPGEKVVRNESCLWTRETPRNKQGGEREKHGTGGERINIWWLRHELWIPQYMLRAYGMKVWRSLWNNLVKTHSIGSYTSSTLRR